MEPQGDSRSQDGAQYPRTWGMDQHLVLSSGYEPWGMVMCLGMGGGQRAQATWKDTLTPYPYRPSGLIQTTRL